MTSAKKLVKNVDMLDGPIFQSLIWFSVPIMISRVFQMLYNTIDVAIVGHVLGATSLAAIGASATIYDFLVGFALGIGRGLTIITARCYGEGNQDKMKRSVAGALVVGGASSIILTVIGRLALRPVMVALNTPAEIFDEAYDYVSLIILWILVMFAYNLFSGMLQAIGNSFMPLVFLVVSSVLNIILDIVLIIYTPLGVKAVAIATVIAQAVSAILCLIYIIKNAPELIPEKKHFKISAAMYKEIIAQGYSLGFMSSIVSAGTVILQSGINGLGSMIIAGHTAARKLMILYNIPFSSIGMAMTTFCSQNRGAGKGDRVIKAFKSAYIYCFVMMLIVTAISVFASNGLVWLLTGSSEPEILDNASLYLRVEAPATMFLGIIFCTRNGLQGLGEKALPIISSVIELIGKILFVMFLVKPYGYMAIIFCEPVIWVAMSIQLLWALNKNEFLRGFRNKKE